MIRGYVYSAAIAALLFLVIGRYTYVRSVPRPDRQQMEQAVRTADRWMDIIHSQKLLHGVTVQDGAVDGADSSIPARYRRMLGEEYTPITTTLGSLEAKELSANPLFAALLVRLIDDSHVPADKPVGVVLSGSFPALAVSVYAALHTLHRKAVIISSMGASTWGANQPGAMWLDMENWLRQFGGSEFQSALITYGAEGDTGGGLQDEARGLMDAALKRNGAIVYVPRTVEESIESKVKFLKDNNIGLLINVGGNQTALGYCSHAESIPNGLHVEKVTCQHPGRGIVFRISESGIPYIHLLNIKNLALKSAITGLSSDFSSQDLFLQEQPRYFLIITSVLVICGILSVGVYKTRQNRK